MANLKAHSLEEIKICLANLEEIYLTAIKLAKNFLAQYYFK